MPIEFRETMHDSSGFRYDVFIDDKKAGFLRLAAKDQRDQLLSLCAHTDGMHATRQDKGGRIAAIGPDPLNMDLGPRREKEGRGMRFIATGTENGETVFEVQLAGVRTGTVYATAAEAAVLGRAGLVLPG